MGMCTSTEGLEKAKAGSEPAPAPANDKKVGDIKVIQIDAKNGKGKVKKEKPPSLPLEPVMTAAQFVKAVPGYDTRQMAQLFESCGISPDFSQNAFSDYLRINRFDVREKIWSGLTSCGNTAMLVGRALMGGEKGQAFSIFLETEGENYVITSDKDEKQDHITKYQGTMTYLLLDNTHKDDVIRSMVNNTIACFSTKGGSSHTFTIVTLNDTCYILQGWIGHYGMSPRVKAPVQDDPNAPDQKDVKQPDKPFGFHSFPRAKLGSFFQLITAQVNKTDDKDMAAAAKRHYFSEDINAVEYKVAITKL